MTTVGKRVAAGMAWLDEHFPGHLSTFDPRRFHIMCGTAPDGSEGACVLMQATGYWQRWSNAQQAAGLSMTECKNLGFVEYPWGDVEELNQEWIETYEIRNS